jgi:(2R)-3-sulfolactate dehydrogenase (NADP+)
MTIANLTANELHDLLVSVLTASGFSTLNAGALARQTVLSEEMDQPSVGVSHMFDYIDGIAGGRINGDAKPAITKPAPTMIEIDGNRGLAQTGFDEAFEDILTTARQLGMCAFAQRNTTLCGALGTYALRLGEAGLVSIAATNGSTLLAGSGSSKPVYCTNPMAFCAPRSSGPPLLIDQSSSATAYVNIRQAAESGSKIPLGWAMDRHGNVTSDAAAALEGTLLAFGGARGANIALMVEVMAAGLTGANWSLDAPDFFHGDQCPATGLFVLALNPRIIAPDFETRMANQLDRLEYDYGVHIPGKAKQIARQNADADGISIDDDLLARLQAVTAKAR